MIKSSSVFGLFLLLIFGVNTLAYSQKAKTIKPPKKGFSKSTEQNQPTGTPDFVVGQQSSEAQKTISTPKKKKNKKKLLRKKSKEYNKAVVDGTSSPPSYNDDISYGISAPQDVKNDKVLMKDKSNRLSSETGTDQLVNTNNVKKPRKEAKKGGNLKGGIPAGQRGLKSEEQNVATGTPDYIVNIQSNDAQKIVSTPQKKKASKQELGSKSKEQNVANQNGFPAVPSYNDDISYGITAAEVEENKKRKLKDKSAISQKSTGEELLEKQYNIKPPREEAKRGGNLVNGVPVIQRKDKSKIATGFQGQEDIKSEGIPNNSSTSLVIPANPKTKNDVSVITKHSGDLDPKSEGIPNNSSTSLIIPVNPKTRNDITIMTKHEGDLDPKSYGKTSDASTSLVIPVNPKTRNDITIMTKHEGDLDPKSYGKTSDASTSLVIPVNPKTRNDITIMTKHEGDLDPKSYGKTSDASTSLVIPVNPKTRNDITIMTKHEGDLDPKSYGKTSDASTSLVIPVNPKTRNDITNMTKHEGDLYYINNDGPDNSASAITPAMKPLLTKAEIAKRTKEMTLGQGDFDEAYRKYRMAVEDGNGIEAGQYSGEINASKLAEIKENRKSKSQEMSSNVGDLEGAYEKMKETEKKNATKVKDYKGTYDYALISKRATFEKELDKVMGSNQGDISMKVYEKAKQSEKDNALEVKGYRGTFDYGILKDREELRKKKEVEIAKNTGDIVGSYLVMRNRWKDQNKKIEDYRGKIKYDVIVSAKDKMKALDKEIYSNTGDILTISLEEKKSNLREKSRKATGYEGDMIVTKRTRSNHPSAVYIEAKDSKSLEAKEKLRKQLLKKSKKHREKEDPIYMRKEAPRPRYDNREYEIWESKTREGDTGFSSEASDKKK